MARQDAGILPIRLIGLRTLRNDSAVPRNVGYRLFMEEKIATYQENTSNVVLQSLPENGECVRVYALACKRVCPFEILCFTFNNKLRNG